jgi:hypothetical protein
MATRVTAALAVVLALGCGREETPAVAKTDAASDVAPTPPPAALPDEAPASDLDALMEWLDPKATGVAWVDLDPSLATETIAAVWALPPRASDMLTLRQQVDSELDAVIDLQAPRATTWFQRPCLVTMSILTSGPYLIRKLARPRAEFEALLSAAKFDGDPTEGLTIYTPRSPFGWRVVLLTDTVVAFIPSREPGSGLSPLTAGRDMPASEHETQLRQTLAEDPTIEVSLFVLGPMLHFDFDPSLRAASLQLNRYADGGGQGIDGRVVFEPESSAGDVATALDARDPVGENEQVRALARDAAYILDGGIVAGRLQVPFSKLAALKVGS